MGKATEHLIIIIFAAVSLILHAAAYIGISNWEGFDNSLFLPKIITVDFSEPVSPARLLPDREQVRFPPKMQPVLLSHAEPARIPATPSAVPTVEAPAAVPLRGAEDLQPADRTVTSPPPESPQRVAGEQPAADLPAKSSQAQPSSRFLPVSRESLNFDIYWMGIHVGSALLEASVNGPEVIIISRVRSNSVLSAFYPVEDYAESRVWNGRASHFKLKQQEGKHRGDKETVFDLERDTVTFKNHLKSTAEPHPMNQRRLWDVLSGFFFVRTMPLKVGASVDVELFDSNRFASTEVKVLRTETVELSGGRKFEAIVIQPMLKTEGLFKHKGEIFIWLTNDERSIPLMIEASIKIGTVTAKLSGMNVEK
jgi:hypothetical protein